MTEHKIFVIGGEDDEFGVMTRLRSAESCHLSFLFRGRRIEATADDFFEAFCQIRMELEKESIIPFCYGASLNVYPSRMSRQMAGGMVAYRLTHGEPAKERVSIFDEGMDVAPSSIENQKAFFADWLASLGSPGGPH